MDDPFSNGGPVRTVRKKVCYACGGGRHGCVVSVNLRVIQDLSCAACERLGFQDCFALEAMAGEYPCICAECAKKTS